MEAFISKGFSQETLVSKEIKDNERMEPSIASKIG